MALKSFTDMQQQLLQQWLKALRSGKYEKSTKRLRTLDDKYDVHGVLCDCYVQSTDAEWQRTADGYSLHGCKDGLPLEVVNALGVAPNMCRPLIQEVGVLIEYSLKVKAGEQLMSLLLLNDGLYIGAAGHSFKELADLIQHTYEHTE